MVTQRRELLRERAAGLEDLHPHHLRESPIHRVGRNRRASEPVDLGEPRKLRRLVEAPQEDHVRGRRVGEQPASLGDELVDEGGGGFRFRVEGLDGERRLVEQLRIALGELCRQLRGAGAAARAEDEDEAMLLHGLDEHLDPGQTDRAQPLRQAHAEVRRDPAGPAVFDAARAIHRAEVPARGDVARAQVELDAERLQDAPPDLEAKRIVAEEPEVPGAATRGNPGRDVTDEPARRLARQLGEIGQARCFELRAPGLRAGEPAEPVERDQHDLGRVRDDQRSDHVEHGRLAVDHASFTPFSICPRPVISSRHVSPGCRKTGGFRAKPTPGGVPVAMRSPGESVIRLER